MEVLGALLSLERALMNLKVEFRRFAELIHILGVTIMAFEQRIAIKLARITRGRHSGKGR